MYIEGIFLGFVGKGFKQRKDFSLEKLSSIFWMDEYEAF